MKFRSGLLSVVLTFGVCGQLSAAQKIALYGKRPGGMGSANALLDLEAAQREGLPGRWVDSPQKQEPYETLLSLDFTMNGKP